MQDTHTTQALANLARKQALSPPLPSDPDDAAGVALALILEGQNTTLPGSVFEELTRRNQAIVGAPRDEIQKTLARQIALLEATAVRLLQKAALAPTPSASAEFTRAALATERVLIQAMGAVHQINQDRNQVPLLVQEDQ